MYLYVYPIQPTQWYTLVRPKSWSQICQCHGLCGPSCHRHRFHCPGFRLDWSTSSPEWTTSDARLRQLIFFRLYGTGHFGGTEHVDKYLLFLEHLGKEENTMEWLVGGIPAPLKNMCSSVGIILPNIGKVRKVMFQTTNHMRIVTPNKKKTLVQPMRV